MPAADPKDQRRARDFERSLREDVLAGRAHRATLDWFKAQTKRVRRSLWLIVETAKHDKAVLEQRTAAQPSPQQDGIRAPRSTHQLLPSHVAPDSLASRQLQTRQRDCSECPQPAKAQPRDLSCLKGAGNPWAGIGRRKTRVRAFCAIGRTYVRHQSITSTPPIPVFALDVPPRCYTRPTTPPGLREALFGCIGLPRIADGPATYGSNTPVTVKPRPGPPVLPPFEQMEITPAELTVYGRRVNPRVAYIVARGRQAMGC
ncbi:hypothetical protein RhiJN_08914 [Ceratobasidium sp. AG-Ba]|nr:hypothetical protein RhiJN_08914 [Ceratobasidium sp. AG-Ba]